MTDVKVQGLRYLMVLAVPVHKSGPTTLRVESAFAQHLRMFKQRLGPTVATLVLMGPALDAQDAEALPLESIEADEGVEFLPLFPARVGRLGFYRQWPRILRMLYKQVRSADVVHAGPSTLHRMFEFPAIVMARALGKKTVYVSDIDHRRSPEMAYRTGRWTWRQYFVGRWIHGSAMHWQHRIAAASCSLVLLKGSQLANDYGRGRPQVKNFLDAAFEQEHVIELDRLAAKAQKAASASTPLRLVYFGRLVAYKGVDHMLRGVRAALDAGAHIDFEIIGDGEERDRLETLASELVLGDCVRFVGAVSFGEALFVRLHEAHVLLAAPLMEDTPRSALDALASGIALVSYDTYYYRELHLAGAPVTLVPWLDHAAMGRAIVAMDRQRETVAQALLAARSFAVPNTQAAWLDKRIAWTRELLAAPT
jgi:glycosyltransferase involved in cell wall biosynthesis